MKALSATEINKLTAAQLKCALRNILAQQSDVQQPRNSELLEEIRNIRDDLVAMKEMKEDYRDCPKCKITHQQNRLTPSDQL